MQLELGVSAMACPVCFTAATNGYSMSNGEVIHAQCLQKLESAITEADQGLAAERQRVVDLRLKLSRLDSYMAKVVRFFSGAIDQENLKAGLLVAEKNLASAEAVCRISREKATPVYELLLDYPPDWPQRCAAVAARDKVCKNCASSMSLQTHHILPLSKGGTNRLSNLKLLCERCHQQVHGGREFSGERSSEPLAIAERVQVLRTAITCREDVEFMYRKPTDKSHTKRRVTPHMLLEVEHEYDGGSTLCLKGYCHLRHAERIFALKRMKGVNHARG